jgi:hypothetical protein
MLERPKLISFGQEVSETGLSLWSLLSFWMKDWVSVLFVLRSLETIDNLSCLLCQLQVKHSYSISDFIVLVLKRKVFLNSCGVRDRTSKQDWSYWLILLEKFGEVFPGSSKVWRASPLFSNYIQNVSRFELASSVISSCLSQSSNYFTMTCSFMR